MAFTGLAIYSDNVFQSLAEDVSDEISIVSPAETKLLDMLGQPQFSATNVLHEWLEDSLAPDTIVTSTAITSTATDAVIGVVGGKAKELRVGQIMISASEEYMRISAVSGNTITLERGFGGTSANSAASASTLNILGDAALEGDDVNRDIGKGRVRKLNYIQLFKKDIIVSGTRQSVSNLGGIGDEFTYQRTKRLREVLRDLEKTVLMSVLSANTIGSDTVVRTMKGLRSSLSTNISSISVLTDSLLGNVLENAWNQGGSDVDVLLVDSATKRIIDTFNGSRVRTENADNMFRNTVLEYEGTYGTQRVEHNRYSPATSVHAIATPRVQVVPLQGRTFQFMPVAKTGDAQKGFIVGEYTLEVRNEEAMARSSASGT